MTKFCCEAMKRAITLECDIHKSAFDCPDCLIRYNEKCDEYGLIIHDGGTSVSVINFCPYCGQKLPESQR